MTRLVLPISPELKRAVKVAAATEGVSMRVYVERVLTATLPRYQPTGGQQ